MTKERAIKPICENRRARHEYEIIDTLEAGIALVGSEVKSLRGGRGNLNEAYVKFENGEAWLVEATISPYAQASRNNHEPKRARKLLLGKDQLRRWAVKVLEKGLTAVPLKMYFKGPYVKLEIALGRGKKLHDKREALKEADAEREMARAVKSR